MQCFAEQNNQGDNNVFLSKVFSICILYNQLLDLENTIFKE